MNVDESFPLLMTPSEVAAQLSISRSSVYGLIEGGHLRCLKIGRTTRVPTRAVEDFIVDQLERRSGGSMSLRPAKLRSAEKKEA